MCLVSWAPEGQRVLCEELSGPLHRILDLLRLDFERFRGMYGRSNEVLLYMNMSVPIHSVQTQGSGYS